MAFIIPTALFHRHQRLLPRLRRVLISTEDAADVGHFSGATTRTFSPRGVLQRRSPMVAHLRSGAMSKLSPHYVAHQTSASSKFQNPKWRAVLTCGHKILRTL